MHMKLKHMVSGMVLLVAACGGSSSFEGGDLGTPYDLVITGSTITTVSLSWKYSGPPETTTGYRIYRDGMLDGWTTSTSSTDFQLWPATNYCYKVTAYNFWSESGVSNTVCTTTEPDQLPPSAPDHLIALMTADSGVSLRWYESTDNHDVTGYMIFRDSLDLLTVSETSFMDTSVMPGSEYCYSVFAIDPSANASDPGRVACVDTDWTVTVLDENIEIGGGIDIALAPAGLAHISYYDKTHGEVKYINSSAGNWAHPLSIDYIGEDRWYPESAITIDTNHAVHICYFDTSRTQLKSATNSSGAWTTHLIDDQNSIMNNCSIAVDSLNNVHILYPVTELVHATNATGSWTYTPLPGTFGAGLVSLVIDSSDRLHASFSTPGPALHYASNQSGVWQSQQIDTYSDRGQRWDSSLGVDSSGNVHVAYGCLKYITNATGSWISDVLSTGSDECYPDMAIDSLDNLHIGYRAGHIPTALFTSTAALKYITNKTGNWIDYTIKTGPISGFYPAIVTDTGSNAHIASSNDFRLSYASNR